MALLAILVLSVHPVVTSFDPPLKFQPMIKSMEGTPKEQAEHFLEWKITNESLIPISKTINNNKRQIIRLKSDLELSWSEANKATLEKNLARLEKHLLKQEEEYFKSLSLMFITPHHSSLLELGVF